MPRNGRELQDRPPANTRGFYDRIADVQNLAMKLNGYRRSIAKYLGKLQLDIDEDSRVLDAGCGTGLATLALHDAGYKCRNITALDFSFKSLNVARDEFKDDRVSANVLQGDVLKMPFADDTFDLALSCGVLEYTPLAPGLAEAARVLKKDALLIFLPVRPSLVGKVLEIFYDFKTDSREEVSFAAAPHFEMIANDEFPRTEPIAWSKTIYLLKKK